MSHIKRLVERVAVLTREVRASDEPVDADLWLGFDANLHRFLVDSIGPHGARVPDGEPSAEILREVVDRYPDPLPSPLTDSPAQWSPAALADDSGAVRSVGLPRRAGLQLLASPDGVLGVALPSPTDPRPVARITCALGALADLVEVHEYQQVPARDDLSINTAHVLAAAAVVARHTLAHGPLCAGDRPLAVGKHAEAGLDALQPVLEASPVRSFRGLPSVVDVDVGDTVLERAVSTWERASQAELRARIPSTDSMRMLLNQGAHITATLETVMSSTDAAQGQDDARTELSDTREPLTRADKAWIPGLTSLVKPGTEFITASRELFLALEETRVHSPGFSEPERDQAAHTLGQAMSVLSRRMSSARSFLRPLADGKALYAPARQVEVSPERLTARLKGRYVPIDYFDIKPLDATWRAAEAAAQSASSRLSHPAPSRAASLC